MARRTQQRDAIRAVIERAGRPLSPQEVLALAEHEAPGLGIATVYRAVSAGVEEGWLKAITLAEGPARYEPAHLEHHHHFRCRLCDRVFDLQGCPGNLKSLLPRGFKLESHDILLLGVCRDCAA